MTPGRRESLLTLTALAAVIGLAVMAYATRNRGGRYAPIAPFVGCYSNGRNHLLLLPNGHLQLNGGAAGTYKIIKPVGGKHGYLVEAEGLHLSGGQQKPIRATIGHAGYFWPLSDQMIELIFESDVVQDLSKAKAPSC